MSELTRFPELENVILIEENDTHEYKEIQSWLKSNFSHTKFKSCERGFFNTETFDCISFEDITRIDKDRFKYQICPVCRVQDSDRALVFLFDRKYIIKKINENSFDYYTNVPDMPYYEGENQLLDVGTFELKYSEYEIVYCIIKKLAKFEIFKDKEEFETVYNFCKTLFDGTEKDFLTCLIHPYKLDGYSQYPHDYNKIEHYTDVKTCLIEIKNGLANKPAPPATKQNKPIKEKPVISFQSMFINPSDYDKVLGYISEYLTDTNQWKETIIYLKAFYGVLRERGYLINSYTAPQINRTLKNEFSIDANTADKNFQSEEINKAVATYADAFNMIPSLKSKK